MLDIIYNNSLNLTRYDISTFITVGALQILSVYSGMISSQVRYMNKRNYVCNMPGLVFEIRSLNHSAVTG
jgi:hypothetical protein